MKMIKMLISFLVGFVASFLIIVYSLQVVKVETTENGAIITIKLFNAYENYYIEK